MDASSAKADHNGSNTQLLSSVHRFGKSVKAIAVTGSINAITMGDPEDLKARRITNDEWNFVSPSLIQKTTSSKILITT